MTTTDPVMPRARRRGITVSARWKITAWIMLTTLLLLVVVLVTARNLSLRDADVRANNDVEQEVAELRRFAAEGVDPTTTRPFTTVERMLEVYLSRQSPALGEVMFGVIGGRIIEGPSDGRLRLITDDPALLDVMVRGTATGGVLDSGAGAIRWGRLTIDNLGGAAGTFVVAVFTQPARDLVDRTIFTITMVGLGGLMLTTGIAYLVAGRILAPVRTVRTVAADIGESDLTTRVPVHGRDEIGALAETFNEMLDRIESAYTTQRQFVDDAGHELRTPITVVRGHLELLPDDPEERAKTLALVDSELVRMGRIVSDLLMLAKAEQPDFVVGRSVDVAALVLDIESKVQALGDRRWLLMEVAEGHAVLDPERVTQAILQLASNAVAHTEDGSTIRLGSRYVEDAGTCYLSLWITDEGPGVRPEDAATIFERFQRGGGPADRTATTRRSGAGLGLAIVRAIADGHHGTAWVRSIYGQGATFGLDVPVGTATEYSTAPADTRPITRPVTKEIP
ncbi:ATP-binding region ATPase domain protein [Gordonia bronchialis DSM 43247]|uniref:histidine kinase n=1 Tax=Gordonia bronchialis (strain ATCC 25592 / DSM 43247 / BCRC 13721 / JCM 3198 / KCTC 3076 / NBRC 16047 / NCTC 10667) TaxID=526226 RepID=D0L5E7_GORB4|nr:ATP-binding protein [Gordonia bronchialis]ACY23405.1 ATP-binding region ATPase domain protein [Gordonia bronchialis DSM 43247]MCC3321576.1 HAMP domain-containing protein [Gordonia bronchialis]STQ66400.1 Probable sensor histidine kinase TcrY [Gordonia bronchialis]